MKIIFLHISNGSEIPLISILNFFVDIFVSFLKRGEIETIVVFRLINDNSKKEKKKKKRGEK